MNITEVRIRKLEEDKNGKLLAVASVTLDGEFVVHDIKVINGVDGKFIAMPSRKMGEGDFRDIAHPIKQDMRSRLIAAVLDEYEKTCNKAS